MTCPRREHDRTKRFGTYGKAKNQRYRCLDCGATFSVAPARPLGRHTTDLEAATRAFSLMLEGMSIRAVSRVTGLHKNTLLRLLLTVGKKCERLFDDRVRNIRPRFVQADELWGYVGKKARRVRPTDPMEFGDA